MKQANYLIISVHICRKWR